MRLENKIKDRAIIQEISEDIILTHDLITMVCGELIGEGQTRKVFEYNLDSDYVIKMEAGSDGDNFNEFYIWDEVRCLKGDLSWVKKWFAPIKHISPCGKYLIMQKTERMEGKKRPLTVPDFLADTHYDNFGWIGNKFVCHDYGIIFKFIKYGKKMTKINHNF